MNQKYKDLLLQLRPEERLTMCCRMFQTVKSMMIAGIQDKYGAGADEKLVRRELFLRLYGKNFPESQLKKILSDII